MAAAHSECGGLHVRTYVHTYIHKYVHTYGKTCVLNLLDIVWEDAILVRGGGGGGPPRAIGADGAARHAVNTGRL